MLIGLVGSKGAGKDTTADYLVKKYNFFKVAFADPLKDTCMSLFQLGPEFFHDQQLKEQKVEDWGISPRHMMQLVGTDIVRQHFGDTFWLRHMEKRLHSLDGQNIVVSDIRFNKEAEFVRSHGGTLIRISKLGGKELPPDEHISELEQASIPTSYILSNKHADIESLYSDIDDLMVSRLLLEVKQPF